MDQATPACDKHKESSMRPSVPEVASKALRRQTHDVIVEQLKYTIWAADASRAASFYEQVFGATVAKQNPHITELDVGGGRISIHGGGEGKRTWTGLTFQVADVVEGAREVCEHGGQCPKEPQPEDGEPPHLAMCIDPEGNEFMLSRKRS